MPRIGRSLNEHFFTFARRITSPPIELTGARSEASRGHDLQRLRNDARLIARFAASLEDHGQDGMLAANDPPFDD